MQKFLLPQYLELMMQAFEKNRSEIQRHMTETFGSVFPFGQMEEMGKQNLAMFEQAMKMFTGKPESGKPQATETAAAQAADSDEIRRELEELKRQVSELSGNKNR